MKIALVIAVLFLVGLFLVAAPPIGEFYRIPKYRGNHSVQFTPIEHDEQKKTIFILAYNKGTEIFDLIAPFYLFQLTEEANVYIVAPTKAPIALMKGCFVLPHYTFQEIDALGFQPAVLAIPHLSAMDKKRPDTTILNWIKAKYSDSTRILSVCAGSFTAAATGLYDGKPLTTHASDMKRNKELNMRPQWVVGVTYTRSGNLYSTAGVSNAVDGSLALISDLFGKERMKAVMKRIHYPHSSLQVRHQSLPVTAASKAGIIKKTLIHKNPNIGVLLQEGIDEFMLSAILDTYHRSFPFALKTYSTNNAPVRSKYGLLILPSGEWSKLHNLDELHIISPQALHSTQKDRLAGVDVITYNSQHNTYIIDVCLQRIASQYGIPFQTCVKRLLDYN